MLGTGPGELMGADPGAAALRGRSFSATLEAASRAAWPGAAADAAARECNAREAAARLESTGGGVNHLIRQYSLESGSLEVEYMEQYFTEFALPKSAAELRERLERRDHLILISLAPSLDDGEHWVPVAFKVGHELRLSDLSGAAARSDAAVADLARRLEHAVDFAGRRVFYSWLGGTRLEWRGQGHYRALTEQQEEWAHRHGYQEFVVKTKNRYYAMRAALDRLHFDVCKFEPDELDNGNSKVYLSKRLSADLLRAHLTSRQVSLAA